MKIEYVFSGISSVEIRDGLIFYLALENELDSFTTTINDSQKLMGFLKTIYSPLYKYKPFLKKDSSDYQIWHEYQILQRIDEKHKISENKPEYMKEDLDQIVERRDDLSFRIKNQLEHIEENKHKIDLMIIYFIIEFNYLFS